MNWPLLSLNECTKAHLKPKALHPMRDWCSRAKQVQDDCPFTVTCLRILDVLILFVILWRFFYGDLLGSGGDRKLFDVFIKCLNVHVFWYAKTQQVRRALWQRLYRRPQVDSCKRTVFGLWEFEVVFSSKHQTISKDIKRSNIHDVPELPARRLCFFLLLYKDLQREIRTAFLRSWFEKVLQIYRKVRAVPSCQVHLSSGFTSF